MKYPEQQHANELFVALRTHLAQVLPKATVTISGEGVRWHCTAAYQARVCWAHCFDSRAPEYYLIFQHDDDDIAYGSTNNLAEVIAAITAWLQEATLATLYDQWSFIDQNKRTLGHIRYDLLRRVPDLARTTNCELEHRMSDVYSLWFRGRERSCEIAFNSYQEEVIAECHWDGCSLFVFHVHDMERTAAVLHQWLCDHAPPSAMRTMFPWLEIGELADYYERGTGVEGEFVASWEFIEESFRKQGIAATDNVRVFIAELRRRGFDRTLRAGQSMWSLVLSRARRYVLREGQPYVLFEFNNQQGMAIHDGDRGPRRFPTIAVNADVLEMLERLQTVPID